MKGGQNNEPYFSIWLRTQTLWFRFNHGTQLYIFIYFNCVAKDSQIKESSITVATNPEESRQGSFSFNVGGKPLEKNPKKTPYSHVGSDPLYWFETRSLEWKARKAYTNLTTPNKKYYLRKKKLPLNELSFGGHVSLGYQSIRKLGEFWLYSEKSTEIAKCMS